MTSLSRRATAAISGAGLVAVFALIRWVPDIGAADRSASLGRLDSGTVLMVVERVALATISLVTLPAVLLALTAYTARRHGVGVAVRVGVSVIGAVASAEMLKRVLPFHPIPTSTGALTTSGSFPSGHSAIAASVALAIVAAVGPRLARLWWGPLVAWVTLVAAGTVATGWHRPSDAVGGVLLAVLWHTALVRRPTSDDDAVVPRGAHERPSRIGVPGWRWWAVAGGAVMAGAVVPRVGADVDLGETATRLYVLGLAGVLATTGALMLVGPQRGPVPAKVMAPRP